MELRCALQGAMSIYLVSFLVFFNCALLFKVVVECRLRLFGFLLSKRVIDDANIFLKKMSPEGILAFVRAAAVSVVLAQRYHSNQILFFYLCIGAHECSFERGGSCTR